MSIKIRHSQIGNYDHIKVELQGDFDDDYCELQEEMSVTEFLKIAAEIIDKNPFYKDLFDKRLLG